MSNNQSSLQSCLGSLDFFDPKIIVPHLVDSQHFSKSVVVSIVFFDLGWMDDILREFSNRSCDLLIKMLRPYDFSCVFRHISDNRRVWFLIVENSLDDLKLTGIVGQDGVVFRCQIVLQGISLDSVFELFEQINWLLNALWLAKIVVNKLLQFSV